MTIDNAASAAEGAGGWADVRALRPGESRLRLAGVLVLGQSALTAWSVVVAALGGRAPDFVFFGVQVATEPQPFVLDRVSMALPLALAIVLPVAVLAVVGGWALAAGRRRPLAMLAPCPWLVLTLCVALAGGTLELATWQAIILAVLVTGATAPRRSRGRGGLMGPWGIPDRLRHRLVLALPFVSLVSMFVTLWAVLALLPTVLGQGRWVWIERPAPMVVWNDSDGPTSVILVGSTGNAAFVVPAHGLVQLRLPTGLGEIRDARAGVCTISFDGGQFGDGGLITVSGERGADGCGFAGGILDRFLPLETLAPQ